MCKHVLIANVSPDERDTLNGYLCLDYDIVFADSVPEVFRTVEELGSELVLVLMGMGRGVEPCYEVLARLSNPLAEPFVPVIVVGDASDSAVTLRCFELHALDFITRPYNGTIVRIRVANVQKLMKYRTGTKELVDRQTERLRKQSELLVRQAERLAHTNERIIDMMGMLVEARSLESGRHVTRVKAYTRILAQHLALLNPHLGLTPEVIQAVVTASALHDVGKVMVPDAVLNKPGWLTEDEREQMEQHTVLGCQILDGVTGIWDEQTDRVAHNICRSHHERWDGSGYPDGLAGAQIPLSAQLVALADVYDALVHERVYKQAYAVDDAYRMIVEGECGAFSPQLLACFERARGDMEHLTLEEHKLNGPDAMTKQAREKYC